MFDAVATHVLWLTNESYSSLRFTVATVIPAAVPVPVLLPPVRR